jgi:hypothetical protein
MNKSFIVISFIFLACLKFEFESPYEDLNGIYLELVKSYDYSGEKLLIEGQNGYILYQPLTALMKYNFSNIDSIYMICYYINSSEVRDFEISNDYAYEALPSYGLRIIDFETSDPSLCGELEIIGGAEIIRLYNNYAYMAGNSNFYVIDVSDKMNPKKIGEFNFNYEITCFEVDSNYAYLILAGTAFRILDIKSPDELNLLYQNDTDWHYGFALNDNYLYFLPYVGPAIETYEVTDSCFINLVSSITIPNYADFICTDTQYGLVLDGEYVYLLNLEYPSLPCVGEVITMYGNPNYGTIKENYIYILKPNLNIIEIKEITE